MDPFGVVTRGSVTAFGAGTVRDRLLGGYPLIKVANLHYLVAIVLCLRNASQGSCRAS
ncbi:UPF0126 domain-containing protein [Ferrimonas sediminum]|uniref:UPF0126 domain-containing protein n=1 Tax=Ferrimonas sediminum TaxID=718193 RepID=A0A1G8SG79_9GAMM|nr:UPF0126 domain-containing protein [Ferrimonas sediminum]